MFRLSSRTENNMEGASLPPQHGNKRRVAFAEGGGGPPKRAAHDHASGAARLAAGDDFDEEEEGQGGTRFADVEAPEAGSDDDSGDELAPDGRSSRPSSAASDDEEDEEGDDGGRLRSKKITRVKGEHAGLEEEFDEAGVAFEPFNLRAERTEGFFDASGEYVRKKRDPEEEPDAWLDDLDAMNPRERRVMQEHARKVRQDGSSSGGGGDGGGVGATPGAPPHDDEEDEEKSEEGGGEGVGEGGGALPALSRARLLETAVRLMREGETVAGALRRFGGTAGSRRAGGPGLQGGGDGRGGTRDMPSFNALTEAVDALVDSEGLGEIYSMDRRALKMELGDALADTNLPAEQQAVILRGATASGVVVGASPAVVEGVAPPPSAPPPLALPPGQAWEYTWPGGQPGAPDGPASVVFGPFTSEAMNGWIGVGYFSVSQPLVRVAGGVAFQPLAALLSAQA